MSGPDEPASPHQSHVLERVGRLMAVGARDHADRQARDAVARDPDDPFAHCALALVLSDDNPEAALESARAAVRLDSDLEFAHWVLSLVESHLGRWADAERSIRRALEINPNSDASAAAYARLLWRLDREPAALYWVEHALSIDPADPDHHALRAQLLLTVPSASWSSSEESARAALAIDPENSRAEAILAHVLLRERRFEEAEAHFRSVLQSEPNNALALRGLAALTMAQFPLYTPLLWLSIAMSRLSQDGRLMIMVGAWALHSGASAALSSGGLEAAADVLLWVYLAFCLWTWFAEPVTRRILSLRYPWLAGAS
jgi:tetratricopeptide (TPR) repeat protein